jgi:hypothetical protein
MNKNILLLITVISILGASGTIQAECNCGKIFHSEGPNYECDCSTRQIHATRRSIECIDQETFFTEGMRISPCVQGKVMAVSIDTSPAEFFAEGYSDNELENYLHLKEAEKIIPASGH